MLWEAEVDAKLREDLTALAVACVSEAVRDEGAGLPGRLLPRALSPPYRPQ